MKPDPFVRAANLRDLIGPGPFALSANGVDIALVRTRRWLARLPGALPASGRAFG
jgi:hypothetical protein